MGTVDLSLSECRRCAHEIVAVANSLISVNHLGEEHFEPLGQFPPNPPGEVNVVQWRNLDEEVRGIGQYVEHLIQDRGFTPGDFLVLCPRRRVAYQIRNELRARGIEAHSFFHEEALEEDEAQEAYALLTLLCRRDDRVALRFWLGYGSQNWRHPQYGRLRRYCENSGDSPYEALGKMLRDEIPSAGYAQVLARFRVLTGRLDVLDLLNGPPLIDALFPAAAQWSEPLHEILSSAEITDATTCNELLAILSEYISQPEIPSQPTFVRVMSLHASKGLTSRVTIVSTVVDSLIPNIDLGQTPAEQERSLREQRRLFYVAITRPREILLISSPARISAPMAPQIGVRLRLGGGTMPSRFLREIGVEHPAISGSDWAARGFR